MYIPKINLMSDPQVAFSFATVVTVVDGVPSATHLPFVVAMQGDNIILRSHFAKANPQATDVFNCRPLGIFTEPHAYISPKHYDSLQSVPTWNYIAVHAYGNATAIDNIEDKSALIDQAIQFYEATYQQQWNGLSTDYKQKMLNGITGFEITVDELQGKNKLSQNRSEKERQSIIAQLKASSLSSEKDIANYMERLK